ncbi:MAG TPA: heavy-metal-associated domain-containing protein [Ktedonobacterales bacterium]|jgi:copper ion binding protein
MASTATITLSVPEISCEHCVTSINKTLGELTGVETVSTDIPTKQVALAFDPAQVSLDQIEAALDDIGYTVAK